MENPGFEHSILPDSLVVGETTRAEIESSDGHRHSGNHRPAMQSDPVHNTNTQVVEPRQANGHIVPNGRSNVDGSQTAQIHSYRTQNHTRTNGYTNGQARHPEFQERRRSLHPPENGGSRSSVDNGRVQPNIRGSTDRTQDVQARSERRPDFSQPHRLDYSHRRTTDPRARRLSDPRVQPGLSVVDSQPRARANEYHEIPRRNDRNFRGVSSATTRNSRGIYSATKISNFCS